MKKIILITGASSGMGKETALQLIKEGHVVYGAARRVDNMQELVAMGGHALKMDVTDHDSIEKGVAQIIEEQGTIDVLVNNAGYAVYGAVEDVSMEDARRQFEVNIFGLARLTQLVLPHMRRQRSGKIINISSVGGKIYTPLGAWYHATKHALEGWSDALRLETKAFGIDVVIVEPGLIATEFGEVMHQPLLDRSENSAYKDLVHALAKATVKNYNKPNAASPSSVIADEISKAINARKPKTRYVAGKMAKPIMSMRRLLSDRAFDKVIMSQLN
jgi:short-subunit dehydrogenase